VREGEGFGEERMGEGQLSRQRERSESEGERVERLSGGRWSWRVSRDLRRSLREREREIVAIREWDEVKGAEKRERASVRELMRREETN
jgi:hypothetical protein